MITVHHLENSRSQRLLWLLEELALPYEIQHYSRDAKTMLAPPALKKVHPLGKSPVITDDGETVAESGAIVEYLIDRYGQGRFRPAADSADYRRYQYWLHYAEGSLMPLLVMRLIFTQTGKRAPLLVRPIAKAISAGVNQQFLEPNLRAQLQFMESALAESPWFAGQEPSGADVQMSFPLEALEMTGTLGTRYPNLSAYVKRLRERPAYVRAMERGGALKLGS